MKSSALREKMRALMVEVVFTPGGVPTKVIHTDLSFDNDKEDRWEGSS